MPRAGRVHHTSSFDEFADTPSNDVVVYLLGSSTESCMGGYQGQYPGQFQQHHTSSFDTFMDSTTNWSVVFIRFQYGELGGYHGQYPGQFQQHHTSSFDKFMESTTNWCVVFTRFQYGELGGYQGQYPGGSVPAAPHKLIRRVCGQYRQLTCCIY